MLQISSTGTADVRAEILESQAAFREPRPNTLESLQYQLNPISILLRGKNPMTNHIQVEHLVDWASNFDPSLLQSEDDVETKFILPFFQCKIRLSSRQDCGLKYGIRF